MTRILDSIAFYGGLAILRVGQLFEALAKKRGPAELQAADKWGGDIRALAEHVVAYEAPEVTRARREFMESMGWGR